MGVNVTWKRHLQAPRSVLHSWHAAPISTLGCLYWQRPSHVYSKHFGPELRVTLAWVRKQEFLFSLPVQVLAIRESDFIKGSGLGRCIPPPCGQRVHRTNSMHRLPSWGGTQYTTDTKKLPGKEASLTALPGVFVNISEQRPTVPITVHAGMIITPYSETSGVRDFPSF